MLALTDHCSYIYFTVRGLYFQDAVSLTEKKGFNGLGKKTAQDLSDY